MARPMPIEQRRIFDRDRQERRFSRPIRPNPRITAPHMNHVGIQTVSSSDSGDRNTGDSRFTDHLLLERQAVSSTLPHPNTRVQLSIYLEMDNWTRSRQEHLLNRSGFVGGSKR